MEVDFQVPFYLCVLLGDDFGRLRSLELAPQHQRQTKILLRMIKGMLCTRTVRLIRYESPTWKVKTERMLVTSESQHLSRPIHFSNKRRRD